ncbi:hypothetical protein HPO96_05660 [Kribbella sandramycini]|uniref:PKD domain-containing protein n=1 Tax=Kribbella sandramycini TaxID=60450 RepID=A0A7Y4NXQ7_9ACTN|nr:hypothetical protein [Kribbella sandramycini]MBB6567673.1 hypothetical protein [Kribbella sandramycini]NOL39726.1 hypothetical protein [Kribbella sandramycini]
MTKTLLKNLPVQQLRAGAALVSAGLLAAVFVAGCNNGDDKPAAQQPGATSAPATSTPAPGKAEVTLTPTLKGRVLTMKITVAGTVLVPLGAEDKKPLPEDTGLVDLSLGSDYNFGDGTQPGGADGGSVVCEGATKQKTSTETYEPADPHTYAKPGTYTFTYNIRFCGGESGETKTTKTAQIVVT